MGKLEDANELVDFYMSSIPVDDVDTQWHNVTISDSGQMFFNCLLNLEIDFMCETHKCQELINFPIKENTSRSFFLGSILSKKAELEEMFEYDLRKSVDDYNEILETQFYDSCI